MIYRPLERRGRGGASDPPPPPPIKTKGEHPHAHATHAHASAHDVHGMTTNVPAGAQPAHYHEHAAAPHHEPKAKTATHDARAQVGWGAS